MVATFRTKFFYFFTGFAYVLSKFELRGPWPGTLNHQFGALGSSGSQLGAPGPLVVS